MEIRLSIVIPVYEGEALVGETLDSLLRQGNLRHEGQGFCQAVQ